MNNLAYKAQTYYRHTAITFDPSAERVEEKNDKITTMKIEHFAEVSDSDS
jgi:hypothetical protein